MALTALGIIEISSNINDYEIRQNAMHYFERAFQANPRNPLCISYLAEHYFARQEYQLCGELCDAGLQVLKNKTRPERSDLPTYRLDIEHLRSNFYFILGKLEHVQERYETAFQQYEESLRHNARNYQTLFCLAKVLFHMGNFKAAETHLNTVLACNRYKDSYEAIRLLAQIKARQSRHPDNQAEAFKLFRHVLELNPHDYDANFEISSLFEETEPKRALVYLEQGVSVMREHLASAKAGSDRQKAFKFMARWPSSFESPQAHQELAQKMIPPEVLNNLAVLLTQEDRDAEALQLYEEARANCERLSAEGCSEDRRLKALSITIRFNLACCHDKASRIGEASEMFKAIINEVPSYTDAYMRLSNLAKKRGDSKRALSLVETGKANHQKGESHSLPTKLFCMQGRLLTDLGRLPEAYKEY